MLWKHDNIIKCRANLIQAELEELHLNFSTAGGNVTWINEHLGQV